MSFQRYQALFNTYFRQTYLLDPWDPIDPSSFVFEKLELDGPSRVEASDLRGRIWRGEVIIFRQGLQHLGLKESIDRTIFKAMEGLFGEAEARRVQEQGLENTHRVLKPDHLKDLYLHLKSLIPTFAFNVMSRVAYSLFRVEDVFYAEAEPNTRINFPFDVVADHQAQFKTAEKLVGAGKITLHGIHQDSWYHHPWNTVNLWCGIGAVLPGNGLGFYPEAWGKYPSYDERGLMKAENFPGPAMNFQLDRGDIVMFRSEQLHASELNQTDQTRFVISMRLTLDQPDYPEKHLFDYRKIRFQEGPRIRAKVANFPSLRFFRDRLLKNSAALRPSSRHDLGRDPPYLQHTRQVDSKTIRISLDELAEGKIHLLSDSICISKINGSPCAFGRYCPHQSADLVTGFIRRGQVVCPRHNLNFDPETGQNPCQSITTLKTYPVTVKDSVIDIQIE